MSVKTNWFKTAKAIKKKADPYLRVVTITKKDGTKKDVYLQEQEDSKYKYVPKGAEEEATNAEEYKEEDKDNNQLNLDHLSKRLNKQFMTAASNGDSKQINKIVKIQTRLDRNKAMIQKQQQALNKGISFKKGLAEQNNLKSVKQLNNKLQNKINTNLKDVKDAINLSKDVKALRKDLNKLGISTNISNIKGINQLAKDLSHKRNLTPELKVLKNKAKLISDMKGSGTTKLKSMLSKLSDSTLTDAEVVDLLALVI